jgi:hypothetical protein
MDLRFSSGDLNPVVSKAVSDSTIFLISAFFIVLIIAEKALALYDPA